MNHAGSSLNTIIVALSDAAETTFRHLKSVFGPSLDNMYDVVETH